MTVIQAAHHGAARQTLGDGWLTRPRVALDLTLLDSQRPVSSARGVSLQSLLVHYQSTRKCFNTEKYFTPWDPRPRARFEHRGFNAGSCSQSKCFEQINGTSSRKKKKKNPLHKPQARLAQAKAPGRRSARVEEPVVPNTAQQNDASQIINPATEANASSHQPASINCK